MKRFVNFTATAPSDFREQMVDYWTRTDGLSRELALKAYGGADFDALCSTVIGNACEFKPDLGYSDNEINGTLCCELADNNFIIPVRILDDGNH